MPRKICYRICKDSWDIKISLCDIEKGRKAVSIERAVMFAEILGDSPDLFVELALQTQIEKAGLDYKVTIEAA
jgi:hypothetical protein